MAFLTITIITAVIATVSIVRYLENAAKNRLPKGVKPLPGPKGMSYGLLHSDFTTGTDSSRSATHRKRS